MSEKGLKATRDPKEQTVPETLEQVEREQGLFEDALETWVGKFEKNALRGPQQIHFISTDFVEQTGVIDFCIKRSVGEKKPEEEKKSEGEKKPEGDKKKSSFLEVEADQEQELELDAEAARARSLIEAAQKSGSRMLGELDAYAVAAEGEGAGSAGAANKAGVKVSLTAKSKIEFSKVLETLSVPTEKAKAINDKIEGFLKIEKSEFKIGVAIDTLADAEKDQAFLKLTAIGVAEAALGTDPENAVSRVLRRVGEIFKVKTPVVNHRVKIGAEISAPLDKDLKPMWSGFFFKLNIGAVFLNPNSKIKSAQAYLHIQFKKDEENKDAKNPLLSISLGGDFAVELQVPKVRFEFAAVGEILLNALEAGSTDFSFTLILKAQMYKQFFGRSNWHATLGNVH